MGILLYAGADGILYTYLKPLIDDGFVLRDPKFLRWTPLFIAAVFLVRGFGSFTVTYFMGLVGRGTVRDFRRLLLRKLMTLPVNFYDNHTSGEIISKINYDTEQVAESITDALAGSIRSGFQALVLIGVMLYMNWRITLILFITAPLLALFFNKVSKVMRHYSKNIQSTMGSVTEVTEEIIKGHKIIKVFAGKSFETARVDHVTDKNLKQEMKMIAITAASVPTMQFMGALALSALVLLATVVPGTEMSAGQFTSMFSTMLGLLRPIKQIAIMNSKLQRGIAGATSIFTLLDNPCEPDSGNKNLVAVRGDIQFKQVNFSYPASNELLENFNLDIKAGETVALVGPSGSGKSTLAALILRFYPLQSGSITIDGMCIESVALESLRQQFAYVGQNVLLFNDTIANNIAYGTDASDAAIKEAAKKACALEFIEKLPDGFNSLVGESGTKLSGGQRQRLAIARAILKDAPILILDEATSALDLITEQKLKQALQHLSANKTTIVIAHRLSTIESADKVAVVVNGDVVEIGTHNDLIKSQGAYYNFYKTQFTHQVSKEPVC